jgi:tyrosine-protein kinase Etk/Wzc
MSDEKQTSKGLLDYILLLLKWRWFIIINFLLVVLITYGITLLLPKWYYSESTVLPPRDQMRAGLGGMGTVARMVGIPATGIFGQSEVYNYLSFLKSRTLQEQIIREFDLMNVYEIGDGTTEDALDALKGNIKFQINDEGALVVGVYDKVPDRAAAMANRFIELLHENSTQLGVQEARARRIFIERRLDQNKGDLTRVEERMRKMQEEHGILILPEQIESGMRSVAELYARRTLKELELDVYRETVGPENPLYTSARLEYDVISRRLDQIPAQTIESLRVFRELLIQQKIFELLTPLLEEARLEELRDTPTVLVLDEAVPSERRARPKRLLITLAMGVVSFILSVSYVVTSQHLNEIRENDPEKYNRILEMREQVFGRKTNRK